MQKKNPVIKNYIYSSKKRIISDNPLNKTKFDNREISYYYYNLCKNDFFLIV